MSRVGNTIKKILRGMLWIAVSLALLSIIIIVLVQVPFIQNRIISHATTYIANKTRTKVEIERISISYSGAVVLKNIFLEDTQKDTLLFVGSAKLRISLIKLIHSKISVDYFKLENAYLNVNRPLTDSLYNFNFLLTSFSDTTTKKIDLPHKESKWTFDVNNVRLKNIRIHFDDTFGGINATLNLHKLDLEMDKIDIVKSTYSIDNLNIESLVANVLLLKVAEPNMKDSDVVLPEILAKKIKISNSSITFADSVRELNLDALINQFELSKGSIDLHKEIVSVKNISLSKSTISFSTSIKDKLTDSTSLENIALAKPNSWVVAAKQIELIDNSIAYNVAGTQIVSNGFDVNHMDYK